MKRKEHSYDNRDMKKMPSRPEDMSLMTGMVPSQGEANIEIDGEQMDRTRLPLQSMSVEKLCKFVADTDRSLEIKITKQPRISMFMFLPKNDGFASWFEMDFESTWASTAGELSSEFSTRRISSARDFYQQNQQQKQNPIEIANYFVTVAWTSTSCAAQLFIQKTKEYSADTCFTSEPILIWPNLQYRSQDEAMNFRQDSITAVEVLVLCENSTVCGTYPKLLPFRISIVVGMSSSNVYCTELQILQHSKTAAEFVTAGKQQHVSYASPVDKYHRPLPLKHLDTRKKNTFAEFEHYFCPKGGVQSIHTYSHVPTPNHDASSSKSTLVWVTYGDGTIVRLSMCWFFHSCCDWWLTSHAESFWQETIRNKRKPKSKRNESWLMPFWMKAADESYIPKRAQSTGGKPPSPTLAVLASRRLSPNTQYLVPIPVFHSIVNSVLLPSIRDIYGSQQAIMFGDSVTSLTMYSSANTSPEEGFDPVAYRRFLSGEDLDTENRESADNSTSFSTSISGSIMGVLGSMWGGWSRSAVTDNMMETSSAIDEADEDQSSHSDENHENEDEGSTSEMERRDSFHSTQQQQEDDSVDSESSQNQEAYQSATYWMMKMHKQHGPRCLISETSLMDPPRKVTSISVDPSGTFAAIADSLGRVMLMDLTLQQVVRMWKGVRDAVCYWIQGYSMVPSFHNFDSSQELVLSLYLVIHAKQRQVVEVWSLSQGSRVVKIDNLDEDCLIVQCPVSVQAMQHDLTSSVSTLCFIVYTDGSVMPIKVPNMLDHEPDLSPDSRRATLDDKQKSKSSPTLGTPVTNLSHMQVKFSPTLSSPASDSAHLKMLKQLLADEESTIPPTPEAIHDVVMQINSLFDLGDALDLVALSVSEIFDEIPMWLQEREALDFHNSIMLLCKEKLQLTVSQSHNGNDLLRFKLQFHSQIMEAYNHLQRFEIEEGNALGRIEDDASSKLPDHDMEDVVTTPRTSWGIEAMSWIDLYEAITGTKLCFVDPNSSNVTLHAPLQFSVFFKVLCFDELMYKNISNGLGWNEQILRISLTDSSRDRVATLTHIFRPLLKDIFVVKLVGSIFRALGLGSDVGQHEQYFGEWFMSLDAREAAQATLCDEGCPILMWLQDLITAGYIADKPSKRIPLERIHSFCSESRDLPRAFMLAAICREAVEVAYRKKEAKSYGAIPCRDALAPWESLLRKLRVCLIFSLRICNEDLGILPISVQSIKTNDELCSVFQWIALDELGYCHKQGEIRSFEDSFGRILDPFDPSLPEGDEIKNVQIAQKACQKVPLFDLATVLKTSQTPYPLVCYFRQFNQPTELAAHRALILAERWSRNPGTLHLLKDSVSALRALESDKDSTAHKANIACAVRVEVWQSRIRPVYRALLFGFEDVPELPDEQYLSLVNSGEWLKSLSKTSLEVISLISRTPRILEEIAPPSERSSSDPDEDVEDVEDEPNEPNQGVTPWPPVPVEDPVLSGLKKRVQAVQLDALEVHRGIICAVQLADNLNSLATCAPSLDDIFSRQSLFKHLPKPPSCTHEQVAFLRGVVTRKAREAKGPEIVRADLDDVVALGKAWGFSASKIRADFILAIYRCGKDYMVGDLAFSDLSASSHISDIETFVEECLVIAAFRINQTLTLLKRLKHFRGIMSVLDADASKTLKLLAEKGWTKAQADGLDEINMPSLSATHELVLKLLRLSTLLSREGQSNKLAEQAHSFSVLSGTLLKAVQEEGT